MNEFHLLKCRSDGYFVKLILQRSDVGCLALRNTAGVAICLYLPKELHVLFLNTGTPGAKESKNSTLRVAIKAGEPTEKVLSGHKCP